MLKRSRIKQDRDINGLAITIVEEATEGFNGAQRSKNPAAVELGRLGGRKGGKARANKLTAARRSEIARGAALARWRKGAIKS